VLESRDCGDGLNVQAVRKGLAQIFEKPRAVGWSRPWSLYVLAKWCEINGTLVRQDLIRILKTG
jgi:hypothetical protein